MGVGLLPKELILGGCDISTWTTEAQSGTSKIRKLILITAFFGKDGGCTCSFHIE